MAYTGYERNASEGKNVKKITEDPILSYIETHLMEEPDQIAGAFGYSQAHFRHLFRTYYDIPLGEYIRRRRLAGAARMVQEGNQIMDVCFLYGFETAAGFAKAFKKEYGFPASEVKKQKNILLDTIPNPVYDRNLINISFLEISEIKMLGKPLVPQKEDTYNLLEEVALWLLQEKQTPEKTNWTNTDCYRDDKIAMWYHAPENREITYLLGPVVKNFHHIPEGMIPVTIPGQKYAIFETKRDSDQKEMAETIRMLCKYIFWEWVPANSVITDKMGFTFERYRGKKAFIYLPLL